MKMIAIASFLLLVSAGPATAQDSTAEAAGGPKKTHVAFVEAAGGYGFQFGEQEYVPKPDGSFRNPLTNGYAFGLTAGWEFTRGLSLIGNWEYARSQSVDGEVENALDKVEGTIDFHTISLGLRWTRALGPGRLYGELGAGVILPFETVVHYDYAAAMGSLPAPIIGSGEMIDEYNLGFGAYGQAGYQWNLTEDLYLSAGLRVKSYQSDNDGKERRFENFVPDMTAPQAVDMTIEYDSSGQAGTAPPRTYSAQDLRALIGFGFRL
jgi:hypothetical protein